MHIALDRITRVSLFLILASVWAGCTNEVDPLRPGEVGGYQHLADRPCPDDSKLTWENFGAPFVLSWCTGCHSSYLEEGLRQEAPLTVNLDHIDDVRAEMDLVWAVAGDDNTTMPPAGGPSHAERELLAEWLACGALTRRDVNP